MGVKVTLMIIDHEEIEDIPERKDTTKEKVENLQISKAESIQEMKDPLMVEDPLIMEDPLMVVYPLMMEDPLIMEDPQEMEDHQEDLKDRDHQDPLDLLDLYVQ